METFEELKERVKGLSREEQIKEFEKSILINESFVKHLHIYLKEIENGS